MPHFIVFTIFFRVVKEFKKFPWKESCGLKLNKASTHIPDMFWKLLMCLIGKNVNSSELELGGVKSSKNGQKGPALAPLATLHPGNLWVLFKLECNTKSFGIAIPVFFFLSFSLFLLFLDGLPSFFANVSHFNTQEICEQGRTYFTGHNKKVSVKIVP